MEVRYPAYYYNFHCLASKCPDSCCKEWAVAVDPESAARYQALPGSLGDDLRSVMQMEDGDTILRLTSDGRCPMWRQDGLCRIQAQLGEEALCYTCRQFPRLRHDYGDFVELGLELSCPEAARLIFSGADSLCSTAISGGESPEYDADAMSTLLRSRAEVLAFLKCRDFTVGQALAVILLYSYAVQEELDGGEVAVLSPAALLKEVQTGSLDEDGDLTYTYKETSWPITYFFNGDTASRGSAKGLYWADNASSGNFGLHLEIYPENNGTPAGIKFDGTWRAHACAVRCMKDTDNR